MAVIDMIGRVCGELTVICPEGHLLAGENLYIGSKGERRCRECGRAQSRKQYWSNPEKHRAYARAYKARKAA